MAGASIDHMVSLTILIAALLVAMMSFNQMFSTAVAYETNTQVATKAVDMMNVLCLSPGSPAGWGKTNDTVLSLGLQDPDVGGYTLDPYSILRLNTASDDNPLVTYNGSSYISNSFGHAVLMPIGDCVNYTTATDLLGITGTYGFNIDIVPTLNVTVEPVEPEPEASNLKLSVSVIGSGLPVSGATLKYYLLDVDSSLSITWYSDVVQTGPSGFVDIDFPIDAEGSVYTFVVYASLGGLNGVGYYASNPEMDGTQYVVPVVEDYGEDDGKITLILTHSWNTLDSPPGSSASITFDSAFYSLTSDFNLELYDLDCSGRLTFGEGFNYQTTQIPSSQVGLLVISYRKSAVEMGSIIVPWGIGTLGMQASFGGGLGSGSSDFVATELRQVTVDGISYQVKVSAWKLGN